MTTLKILYVEDNDDLRDAIAMLLESDHREITTCVNAEEALVAVGQHAFDVLVTDVSLPGLSGIELARRVLQDAPQLRVVLCSGHALGPEVKALGAHVHVLPKPFEIEELERLL